MALYINNFIRCAVGIGLAVVLAGCATVHKATAPASPPPASNIIKHVDRKSVQHKVLKGQTLWSIAKVYKVSVEDIIQANAIPNAASIEQDQLIVIPGADGVREVPGASAPEKDGEYAWPVKGKVIAYFDDFKDGVSNAGIDVNAVEGEVVKAARPGRVVLADHLSGYGSTVIIDHGDGFFTVYAHNERLMVKLGDFVLKGEMIAQVAREGSLAYLHFEVRKGHVPTNPLHYLP